MITVSQKIIAYLEVNNIYYNSNDFVTGLTEANQDIILYWNFEALGTEPTEAQMNEAYLIWEGQQIAEQNKTTASQLLTATDWTATVDINDPQYSNPYLGNQPEFLAYRSSVRQIAVNPPVTVATWPTKPDEVWVTT
mgnify:CR=1 FL=1